MTVPEEEGRAWGNRARLGLIVPPTNTVNEAEWAMAVPSGVTFHTHRMRLHSDTQSPTGKAALRKDLAAACAMLTPTDPAVIAYACTAGSMAVPVEDLPRAMQAECGTPCVTTSEAVVAALRSLNARRLSVATPYHDRMNAHEARFLNECGFDVAGIAGLGIGAGGPSEFVRIARTGLGAVRAHAEAAFRPESDALVLLCTDLPTAPLIPMLETRFDVPVVTSNQATLWLALRRAGVADRLPGLGRLFAEH